MTSLQKAIFDPKESQGKDWMKLKECFRAVLQTDLETSSKDPPQGLEVEREPI